MAIDRKEILYSICVEDIEGILKQRGIDFF